MLPLKDDIPTDRVPVVTLLLIAAAIVAQLLGEGASVLQLLAGAWFLWIFGTSVEDAMSRPRFLALCLLAGAAAAALARALDGDASLAAAATAGVAAAALGGHLRLYPRAHVVTLLPLPTAFTLVEVPTWALLAAWLAVQAAFAAFVDGGAAAALGSVAGLALGLAAAGLLAQRRKAYPPPPSLATPAAL